MTSERTATNESTIATPDRYDPNSNLGRAVERMRERRARRAPRHAPTGELDHVGDVVATMGLFVGTLTELMEQMRGLSVNHVVKVETVVLDAAGTYELSASKPCASITASNLGATNLTIAGMTRNERTPTKGVGVVVIGPNRVATFPLASTVYSLYGAPAASVTVVLWSRLQPPAAGPIA